ncbi:toxin-activating lysine-acyltransferase [Epibacterium sp. SM1969]|uniref:RTX toxin-activating lysine-acyltransferase n=1 Tax=Tritonibacter aquimaris TaxID=2663379 RepID=A0A844ANY7_9RHOB|nr:toxin-activating lysine-acyltransferase [Tritonibacter aquimaris]MQY44319.1 toxin-activating lysine-acyltransferase [Tritonibacter aquimaris]
MKAREDDVPVDVPDARTFGSTLGNAVWLMSLDNAFRDLPLSCLEARVSTPILLRHFKLYSKEGQPVAFLTWASVSDYVRDRIEAGGQGLSLDEWRSGQNIVVVDVVSPFNPRNVIEEKFWQGVKSSQE